jgi:hypothetical protein
MKKNDIALLSQEMFLSAQEMKVMILCYRGISLLLKNSINKNKKHFKTSYQVWIFISVVGLELEASCLLGRHSTIWAMPPAQVWIILFFLFLLFSIFSNYKSYNKLIVYFNLQVALNWYFSVSQWYLTKIWISYPTCMLKKREKRNNVSSPFHLLLFKNYIKETLRKILL